MSMAGGVGGSGKVCSLSSSFSFSPSPLVSGTEPTQFSGALAAAAAVAADNHILATPQVSHIGARSCTMLKRVKSLMSRCRLSVYHHYIYMQLQSGLEPPPPY